MKRLRRHPLFLVAIAVALPLGAAILYFDFYADSDLVCFQQLSTADNEDLFHYLRKNPRVLAAADAVFQSAGLNILETSPFHALPPASTAQRRSVLRC
jgi:hypothetical protein